VWVECLPHSEEAWERLLGSDGVVLVDHHNPGDTGFGAPPERALEASSLGQVIAWIDAMVASEGILVPGMTAEERLTAAMDHCLGAAAAGLVPGVSRESVAARLWVTEPSGRPGEFSSIPEEDRAREIDRAGALPRLRWETPAGPYLAIEVADARGVRVTRAALLLAGRPYIAEVVEPDRRHPAETEWETERAMGFPDAQRQRDLERRLRTVPVHSSSPGEAPTRKKVVLGGYTTAALIEAFRAWAADQGLVEQYPPGPAADVAARGFAGAYLP
jgi:hypothetical protein